MKMKYDLEGNFIYVSNSELASIFIRRYVVTYKKN